MTQPRRRNLPLALESLEERKVLSALMGSGHALVGEVHAVALKIPTPKLPKIPTPKLPKIPTPKLPNLDPRGAIHELAGEMGRVAYPTAAATMIARNDTRPPHRLSVAEKKALRPYFGDLVDRVTIYYGADPIDAWSAGGYTIKLGSIDTGAQTYGLNIYIRSAREDMTDSYRLQTIIHELTHSQQYEKYGSSLSNFGYHYFKEWSKANRSYAKNALEREAEGTASSLLDKVNAAYQATQAPNPAREQVSYTIRNDSGKTVSFKMQPSGKSYTLAPGKTASYTSQKVDGVAPTLTVVSTGRTYKLVNGDHKFFWMKDENRIGFDLNYKK